MFHWICPECGREIPPSERECQACDPSAAVEPVETTPLVSTLPEPVSQPKEELLLLVEKAAEPEVIEKVPDPVAASVQPEYNPEPLPVVEKAAEPEVIESASSAEPNAEPAPAAESVPVALAEPLPVVEKAAEPEVIESVSTSVAASVPVAQPEPVAEPLPVVEKAAEPEVVESAPSVEPVAELAAAASVAEAPLPASEPAPAGPTLVALAESPAPLVEPQQAAAAPVEEAESVPEPAKTSIEIHEVPDPLLALAEEIRAAQAARAAALVAPAESSGLLELAEAVGTVESAPVAVPEVLVQAAAPVETLAMAEVTARFNVSSLTAVLDPPWHERSLLPAAEPVGLVRAQPDVPAPQTVAEPEGPTLPLAPMQNYTPATSRSIQPVPPRAQILAADSGPRITLPGPTLPPELTRLQDANVVTLIGEPTAERAKEAISPKKSAGGPGWFVSIGVMLLLLAAGLGVVFYLLPHTVADAKPGPTPAQAATTPAPAGPSSPLAKFIEVTGFRVVVDENKKSEVQYLVVNHSAADISDANIFITLRSVKPGQPPVCRFSFKVPSLAPFESKEMSSPIEKTTRGITLPDWQDLRADVQIN